MRIPISVTAILGAALAVSACATTAENAQTYNEELTQLSADCEARDGIIVPIGNNMTGDPRADYACRLPSGAGRLD